MEPWSRETLLEHMSNFDVSDEAGQLVFADWLEENGQDGWANLCRLFRNSRRSKCPQAIGLRGPDGGLWFTWIFPEWIRTDSHICYGKAIADWKSEFSKNLQIS